MPRWKLGFRIEIVAVLLAFGAVAPSSALAKQGGDAQAALAGKLRALVQDAALGDEIGIAVADARSGRFLFDHRADKPLNPASNMKLVTATAALLELGPSFRMRTGLHAHIEDGAVTNGLYLKGYGDPTLRLANLISMARELATRGVKRVDEVVVDGAYFDDQRLPPAFEQQPHEHASFRAAVGAVAVDHAAYALRLRPGAEEGHAVHVDLDARGYFKVESSLKTTPPGAPSVVAIQRPKGHKMELLLRGGVPAGVRSVTYRRRVEHPLAHAGHALIEALKAAGIATRPRVRLGETPSDVPLQVSRQSPQLATIIHDMGKESDNFTAEMLLKVIGAEVEGTPGSSEAGAHVASKVLQRAGVAPGSATLVNGSGLFDGNQIAASHLVKLLTYAYRDPAVGPELVSCLAVGGKDGTLSRRLENLPAPRIVRAKTGTLDEVIALSGYVLGPENEDTLVFSFLANGVHGKHHAARTLADDIVNALAAHLYPKRAQ